MKTILKGRAGADSVPAFAKIMRRFTAYIFDLDGVLCHTDKFHFAAWAALAKKLDLPFDASVNDRLRGVSRMESLDIVLGEKKDAFTAEQKTLFAKEKNAIYRGYLQTMTPADLDEDVRSTLLKLRADGHKLAVGSSSKNAPLILERIGLGSFSMQLPTEHRSPTPSQTRRCSYWRQSSLA